MLYANYYYYAEFYHFIHPPMLDIQMPLECLENHMILGHTLFLSIPLCCVT